MLLWSYLIREADNIDHSLHSFLGIMEANPPGFEFVSKLHKTVARLGAQIYTNYYLSNIICFILKESILYLLAHDLISLLP
jgi:hypothetical protein